LLRPPPSLASCLYTVASALLFIAPLTAFLAARYVRVIAEYIATDPATYLEDMRPQIRWRPDRRKALREQRNLFLPVSVFVLASMLLLPHEWLGRLSLADTLLPMVVNMGASLILCSEVWRRRRATVLSDLLPVDVEQLIAREKRGWRCLWG
jgi:hypothetical protein